MLGAEGRVFSAGHDFVDVAARDLAGTRELAAGCQLVASCDLAVAAESAGFALPGGKGGWFCHTPAVPVARAIGRKRLMAMALTGDVVDARTALEVMAAASQLPGAKEGMAAFLEKRTPIWTD